MKVRVTTGATAFGGQADLAEYAPGTCQFTFTPGVRL
jgi:hypothetical protein